MAVFNDPKSPAATPAKTQAAPDATKAPQPVATKPSGGETQTQAQQDQAKRDAEAQAKKPGDGSAANPIHMVTDAGLGEIKPPEQAAPDGTDPSRYPADGTRLEGLVNGPANAALSQSPTVKAEVLGGNPPPYDSENAHGIVEVPSDVAGRLPVHMKLADFAVGKNCYKLGVSHPPYVIEAAGNGFAVLRSGTGGTVHIANNDEASFYTLDQNRQYAVADGNPNVSGDVKHP